MEAGEGAKGANPEGMETALPVLPAPGATNGSRPHARAVSRRRRLPGGRAVVGGLLVASSAVGVFAAQSSSGSGPTDAYVVLTRDVAPGQVLVDGDLALVGIDLPAAQRATSFTDPGVLVGTVVVGGMKQGQLVQSSDVAEVVSAGERAQLSVPVSGASAMNGDRRYLRPGEHVAVIVTYDRGGEVRTETVSSDALVVDVLVPERGLGAGGDLTVVLAVRPDELEAVAGAAAVGRVTLARTTGLPR
jgi:Flp pilus assembly protein CpaB